MVRNRHKLVVANNRKSSVCHLLVEGTGTRRTNSSSGRLLLVPTATQAAAAATTATAPARAPTAESTALFSDEPVKDFQEFDGEPVVGLLA